VLHEGVVSRANPLELRSGIWIWVLVRMGPQSELYHALVSKELDEERRKKACLLIGTFYLLQRRSLVTYLVVRKMEVMLEGRTTKPVLGQELHKPPRLSQF
jgi:hypothetical protein